MRRGGGRFDYGFRDRVDYEAMRRERIVDRGLRPSTFVNAAVFLAVGLTYPQGIAPASYVDPDTFGSATVARPQAQALAPASYTDSDSFGAVSVGFTLRTFPTTAFVAEGDSLTVGYQSSNPSTKSWPAVAATILGVPFNNQANTGDQLTGIDSAYASTIAPLYNSATYNTVTLMAGSNDIGVANAPVSTLQAGYQSFASKARATGYKIGVGTILPRGDFTGAQETVRTTFNTWLRANWNTFADVLLDFAARSELSTPSNTTYFNADAIHLTDAGYAVMATVATGALGRNGLVPASYTDADAFGTAALSVAAGVQGLTPATFTDGDTFGTATVATAGASFTTATWGIAGSQATISGADLIIANNATFSSARVYPAVASGVKAYIEIITTGVSVDFQGMGPAMSNQTSDLETYLGNSAKGALYWFANKATLSNGVTNANSAGTQYSANNNRLMIAIDRDGGKAWIGQNGTWWVGDPAAGTSPWVTFTPGPDSWYFGVSANGSGASGNGCTLRLPTSLSYTPPTGYTPYHA